MVRRVGLVSCVKGKLPRPAPARDLYVSDYFRKMRTHVEQACGEWRILSARHGLVHPDALLAPYDKTLVGASRATRQAWAEQVHERLRSEFTAPDRIVFEFHASNAYLDPLEDMIVRSGYRAEVPLRGLRIGERLRWYKDFHSSAGRVNA